MKRPHWPLLAPLPGNPEESRVLTEALFTSIGDGIIATDEFGKVTHVNPTALKLLGYRESEVIGKWFPNVVPIVNEDGKPVNLIERPITKAFLTGKPISEKVFYRKKNGQPLPVSITVAPIIVNERPRGAIEVFRDITLEQEIDRMKSEFISLASHQLRTPLSAIKTYSHMLVDGYMGELNDAQKQSLHTVIGAANRMNELISTLLNVTRIEGGTIALSPKKIRLGRLLEETVKEHAFQATEKNIELTFRIPDERYIVTTDHLIAKEIIANLVSNAIKYTPEGGKVMLSLSQRANDYVISVRDTGVGIPKFAQDQVFTKFFRAHNVIKRETSGTGLGLYLVRGLVETLGGKIWFKSEEDKGSTFYVALPKKAARLTAKAQAQ